METDSEKLSIFENIPEILTNTNKNLLYIGASSNRIYLYEDFLKLGYMIDIIEIYEPNVNFLKSNKKYNVICGDIRNIDKIIEKKYDIILWWHGPEHIRKEELGKTLFSVEKYGKLVILGCPLNEVFMQQAIDGNTNEIHLWSVKKEDLEKLGYITKIVNRPSHHCDHLTAWKFTNT